MALRATSTGSPPKRAGPEIPAFPAVRFLRAIGGAAAVALALGMTPSPVAAQLNLLPNERAFAFSARGLDDRTVEAHFAIADGYYLYREKLKFTVDPGALAAAALPPGTIKDDEFFGKVETFRDQLVIRLPLAAAAPGQSVTITAESQGCADIGVCYPPQVQKVTVALPAAGARPGAPVEAAPQKKSWFN